MPQRDDELQHVALDAATQTTFVGHIIRAATIPLGSNEATTVVHPESLRALLANVYFQQQHQHLDRELRPGELDIGEAITQFINIAAIRACDRTLSTFA